MPILHFELTARQAQLRNLAAGPARHILAYGGSRSGKTFGLCYCIAARALSAPGSRHLIARRHHVDVRTAVMMDTWPKMMRLAHPGLPTTVSKSNQLVTFPNGSEVWFGGLDDADRIEKILGKEFATIYVNECSQIAYPAVLTLRTRLAQSCTKVNGTALALKAYYDLNPTGRGHWTYREFVEGVSPVNGVALPQGRRAWIALNPADNPHLPASYLDELDALPERQRQRFRHGTYLAEAPGALWSLEDRRAEDGRPLPGIDSQRRASAPELTRVVIGVDPSGSDGSGGDHQGILVVGLGTDGRGYVLEDCSVRMPPAGWAQQVARAYTRWNADRVVAEVNFGGAMVESTLRTADTDMPVRLVHASRGKHLRAEPIAALYEQGRVSHVGVFAELEAQMGLFTTQGYQSADSPDRVDALVWALSELMLGDVRSAGFLALVRSENAAKASAAVEASSHE